jgi:flavin reductase (DIM6/NTAB) family NADH-FMN oxidoreductase RutF
MGRSPIDVSQFKMHPFFQWDRKWFLLSSGDFQTNHFNAMTISWGSMGIMWNKPFVQVVVRPVRYTYEFMQQCDTFTICAFSEEYRKALQILGAKSGRNSQKMVEAGLTPVCSEMVPAPGYAEAELVIECRKIYLDDMHPGQFLDQGIEHHYPHKDYHRIYYGEVLYIAGEADYC